MFASGLPEHPRAQGGAVIVVRGFRVASEGRVRAELRQPARVGRQLQLADNLLHHARQVTEKRIEIHVQHPARPLVEDLATGQ